MAQYLAEKHLNSEGELDKKSRIATRKRPCKKKAKLDINPGDKAKGSDDSEFISISSDSDASGDSSAGDDDPLTNAEVSSPHPSNHIYAHFHHSACQCPSYQVSPTYWPEASEVEAPWAWPSCHRS